MLCKLMLNTLPITSKDHQRHKKLQNLCLFQLRCLPPMSAHMGTLANMRSLVIILLGPAPRSSSRRARNREQCNHGLKMALCSVPVIGSTHPLRTLRRQSSPVHPAFLYPVQSCGRHTLSAVLSLALLSGAIKNACIIPSSCFTVNLWQSCKFIIYFAQIHI